MARMLSIVSMLSTLLALLSLLPPPATCQPPQSGPQSTIYDSLLDHLFSNETYPYRTDAMPLCRPDQRLEVGQDMVLMQLFDLDEPTQMLTIDVWIESTWKDCRLGWDPKRFNNLTNFAIKSESIWYPDLIFYESLHGNFEEGMFIYGESTARVYSDGSIQLGNQVVFKVFCRIDIAKFPYDRQICNITFSSWTKDISKFRLRKKSEESSSNSHAFESASNGEWQVEGFPSAARVSLRKIGMDEASGGREFSEVVFQLQLRRKPLFYQAYMLFPCLLLTWLTLFVFLLPADSGEKVGFVTTILLSLVVFLLLIADNIPRSGDSVPVLGVYFCLAVGLVALANIMTVFVYNLALRGGEFRVPTWLLPALSLSKWCGVTGHVIAEAADVIRMRSRQDVRHKPQAQAAAEAAAAAEEEEEEEAALLQRRQALKDANERAWRLLALTCDRLCFVVFFLLNVVTTGWILGQGY